MAVIDLIPRMTSIRLDHDLVIIKLSSLYTMLSIRLVAIVLYHIQVFHYFGSEKISLSLS